MFPRSIEDRYKYDATFNRVVDQMRQLLRMYHITPSELREASILAATMHMNENIVPLFLYPGLNDSIPYPSLFGGASASNAPMRTASGAAFNIEGTISGRIPSSKPNKSNTPQEAKPIKWGSTPLLERRKPSAVFDRRKNDKYNSAVNTRDKWERIQHIYATTNRSKTGDRRKPNWVYYAHDFGKVYGAPPNQYYVCKRCGLSDVYIRDMKGPQHCSVKP